MHLEWYTKYNNGVMELHMHFMLNSFNASTWTPISFDGLWMAYFWISGDFYDGIVCKLNATTDNSTDSMNCEDSYLIAANQTILTDSQNDVIYDKSKSNITYRNMTINGTSVLVVDVQSHFYRNFTTNDST
jgi:hypothetical protein